MDLHQKKRKGGGASVLWGGQETGSDPYGGVRYHCMYICMYICGGAYQLCLLLPLPFAQIGNAQGTAGRRIYKHHHKRLKIPSSALGLDG